MSCETRAYDTDHGEPVAVLVVKGHHDALEDARHNRVIAAFLADYAAKAGA